VDSEASGGYDFGLGARVTMGGSGATVGGTTAVDILTDQAAGRVGRCVLATGKRGRQGS
jgi:hypothetical protein